jgi:hypothetical protein
MHSYSVLILVSGCIQTAESGGYKFHEWEEGLRLEVLFFFYLAKFRAVWRISALIDFKLIYNFTRKQVKKSYCDSEMALNLLQWNEHEKHLHLSLGELMLLCKTS